jgi:hypothetical protein
MDQPPAPVCTALNAGQSSATIRANQNPEALLLFLRMFLFAIESPHIVSKVR